MHTAQPCRYPRLTHWHQIECSGFDRSWQQKRHADVPPPTGVRRIMERNRQKLVGRDKGSLKEQQTKGTVATMIQKRGIHRTNQQNRSCRTEPLSRIELLLCPPKPRASSRHTATPPTGIQHDSTWYGLPGSVWPGWSWVSPPFLHSGEN